MANYNFGKDFLAIKYNGQIVRDLRLNITANNQLGLGWGSPSSYPGRINTNGGTYTGEKEMYISGTNGTGSLSPAIDAKRACQHEYPYSMSSSFFTNNQDMYNTTYVDSSGYGYIARAFAHPWRYAIPDWGNDGMDAFFGSSDGPTTPYDMYKYAYGRGTWSTFYGNGYWNGKNVNRYSPTSQSWRPYGLWDGWFDKRTFANNSSRFLYPCSTNGMSAISVYQQRKLSSVYGSSAWDPALLNNKLGGHVEGLDVEYVGSYTIPSNNGYLDNRNPLSQADASQFIRDWNFGEEKPLTITRSNNGEYYFYTFPVNMGTGSWWNSTQYLQHLFLIKCFTSVYPVVCNTQSYVPSYFNTKFGLKHNQYTTVETQSASSYYGEINSSNYASIAFECLHSTTFNEQDCRQRLRELFENSTNNPRIVIGKAYNSNSIDAKFANGTNQITSYNDSDWYFHNGIDGKTGNSVMPANTSTDNIPSNPNSTMYLCAKLQESSIKQTGSLYIYWNFSRDKENSTTSSGYRMYVMKES